MAALDKLLSSHRILIVEDEFLILMMIEGMLADLGCRSVVSATSVGQALTLVAARAFDLALLDMNLGGIDSRPVAEALVRRCVPFIYCTGNSASDIAECHLGHPVLRKPFSVEDLAAAVALSGVKGEKPLNRLDPPTEADP